MIQPTHHPSVELILDHARGALEDGRALVVAAHLGACSECRAALGLAEAIGGALMDELEPVTLADNALSKVLAKLDASPSAPPQTVVTPRGWIRVPHAVITAAESRKRWAAPGVWVANVTGHARARPRSYLLGVGAGIAVPKHTHKGTELTCVLKGAFEDRGVLYGPGDFAECDETVEHRPRVTLDGECVCLAAADSALIPRDLIGRLMQPFVGV